MREVDLIGRIETPITLNARMNANAVTTTNYNELGNKPKINGVTLYGDLTPEELGIFYGAPFVANTVAEMTNTDKVYVYTGSETGYVAGNWYYYNGSEWVSGGVYNSAAVQTDRTLTQEDKAADAKAVGDALAMKAGIIEDTVTGEIVSFVPDKTIDKLLDASLEMSPIQSLNGYDSPWPAGGGKNKLPYPYFDTTRTIGGVTFTVNSDGTVTTSGTATETASLSLTDINPGNTENIYSGMILNGCPSGGATTGYAVVAQRWNGATFSNADFDTGNGVTIGSSQNIFLLIRIAAGTNANGLTFKPMIRAAGTDASFSPYSNICPISWHTGAELIRTGKNLLDGEYTTNASGATSHRTTDFAIPKEGTTITASAHTEDGTVVNTGNCAINFKTSGNVQLLGISPTQTKIAPDLSTAAVVEIFTTAALANKKIYVQLEYGSAATEYEPYDGDTYSVTFPETIYGGSHEFVSGKAAATMAKYTITGANIAAYNKEGNLWRITITGINYGTNNNYKNGLCDCYTVQTSYGGVNSNNNSIGFNSSDSTQILIRDDTFTRTNIRDLLNANPLEVVYPLATPLEYTLSPQQITTLQGQNVVWGNGTATVKYAADAKTYIDNKIAAAVAALS